MATKQSNLTIDSNITEEDLDFIYDWGRKIKKPEKAFRITTILRQRLLGKSLKEIADGIGVTRERVRQLEALGVEVIRHSRWLKVNK